MTLKMTVEGKGLELEGEFEDKLPEIRSAIVYKAFDINADVVPVGETHELQDSFYFDVPSNDQLIFGWKSAHARFVDQGVPPSEGRYVPFLGKRLTLHPKERRGVPKKEFMKLKQSRVAIVTHVHSKGEEWENYDIGIPRHQNSQTRPYAAHAHLMQARAHYAFTNPSQYSQLPHRNIGMHPGFKGRNFVKEFVVQLRTVAVNETIKCLQDVINHD
jgi:hypothetical protein